MASYANILPIAMSDGVPYSVSMFLPPLEGDLFNQSNPPGDPIPVNFGEAVLAIVQLTATRALGSNTSYVILQTDLGDNAWVDVCGILWTGTSGSATFALSAGVAGNNALQQTRVVGIAPAANFSNQMCLGGRIRFVGKASFQGSSSSSSSSSGSVGTGVQATIRYKILGLR